VGCGLTINITKAGPLGFVPHGCKFHGIILLALGKLQVTIPAHVTDVRVAAVVLATFSGQSNERYPLAVIPSEL
jgi:hypothetical protein